MSSIDKYVEDYAKGLDRRVTVTNSGGMITGKINGRVVFRVPDRYGYLSESEKRSVSSQMNAFFNEEAEARRRAEEEARRRREEEERRRREEEERRRRLEEARKAAVSSGITSLNMKKGQIQATFSSLKMASAEKIKFSDKISNSFDVRGLENALNSEIERTVKNANDAVEREKNSYLQSIESTIRTLNNATSAEKVNDIVRQKLALTPTINLSSYTKEINETKLKLRELESKCNEVYSQITQVATKYNNSVTQNLLKRVKNIEINKVSDLSKITQIMNESVDFIKSEAEKEEFEKSISGFNEVSEELSNLKLASSIEMGNVYEIKTFDSEIRSRKEVLLSIKESILAQPYTIMNQSIVNSVDRCIENSDLGEVKLNEVNSLINILSDITNKDKRLEPSYNAFIKARNDALSYGLETEGTFDPTDPDSQLDRILDAIVTKQIESEKEIQVSRAISTKVLMESLGYNILGFEEAGSITSMIFARSDLKGVVMEVDVTTEGIRRKLVGVKTKGVETSIEDIKEAARVLEREDEPANFMSGYNTIYPDAAVGEDFGFADDPNADEVISNNGVYDLDETNKVAAFNEITGVNTITERKVNYIPSRSMSVKVAIQNESKKYQKKRAQALKARYQTL